MGGPARALALGLAIGSLPSNNNGVLASVSTDPRLRASKRAFDSEICGLRVTMSGDAVACGDGAGGAGCDRQPFARQADRLQVFVGDVPREAAVARRTGTSAWRQAFDFGCVNGKAPVVLTVYDNLLRSLVTCEAGEAHEVLKEGGRVCHGAHGASFSYMVERDSISPPSMDKPFTGLPERLLQAAGATPAPTASTALTFAPQPVEETDPPVSDTPAPIPEATEEPTPEPTPEITPAPVPELTEEPTAEPTAERTAEPTAEETPSPVAAPTARPVSATAEPTPAPVAPVTAEPTLGPTAAPVPEPTAAPVGTPPTTPTGSPVSEAEPTSPPTADPTTNPSAAATVEPSAAPVTIDAATVSPVGQPTGAPADASTAMPTDPAAGTTMPTPAPTVTTAGTPAPTVAPTPVADSTSGSGTLSPNSDVLCDGGCYDTGEPWTGTYRDYRCNDGTELAGCLDDTGDYPNCRTCFINKGNYEDETGVTADDWPDCPCCVAEMEGLDPQTEECEAEDGVSPTPSPTSASIDLTSSENDPDLMMMAFNSEDCTASGFAITGGGSRVMEISSYTQEDGSCGSSFDVISGDECESSDLEYSWSYQTGQYQYEYSCDDGTSSFVARRRLLALADDDTKVYSSATLLCNNDESFISLASLDGDETGLVYAKSSAVNFNTSVSGQDLFSGGSYCGEDVNTVTTTVLETGVENVLEDSAELSSEGDTIAYAIIIPLATALVLLLICGCFCCYRHRKGKEGRAGQMRRNLGYTEDMEAKGDGNFGPTNKHVAITRGGGPQVTPEMPAAAPYQQATYPLQHHRAPSEAPSSIIEDNIANNYRPKTAAKNWEKRKVHKELTKPASQQHIIGAGPTSEELKTENMEPHSQSARSEQLSEHSLSQLQLNNKAGALPTAGQGQYGYAFEDVEVDGDDDDDARSAATGMSGPSKYAPSGYAPSSHHGGVTHDLMSQYEPSVYEADSQYDPSLYGRESEYGDESSSYSFNQDSRSSSRGGYSNHHGGRGGGRHNNTMSGRASVADTAAMSHLGSVMEDEDAAETNSAYAPSDSYVSSYISSEDEEGRPARSVHPRGSADLTRSPSNGYGSRHNVHRSGRESGGGGGAGEGDSRDYDDEEDDSVMRNVPVSMEDLEYYSEDNPSTRDAPLTDVDERHGGRRW